MEKQSLFDGTSMKHYNFWRYHGLSPKLSLQLAIEGLETPQIYEQKEAVDNANTGGFTHVIGLKKG